jgi:queuine/archaeosine tRNA-ribosyltransferase
MDPLKTIEAVANVGTAAFKEATQHEALMNSPQMIQMHVLEAQQAHIDELRKAISNEDVETYRRIVAAGPSQQ